MATRKQRRRREKEMRHEYVWEDEEGNQVDPLEARRQTNGSDGKARSSTGGGGGGGRRLQPPSWRRTFKRGLIFGPLFLGIVLLLNGSQGLGFAIVNTVFLLVVFVPFSYLIDKLMWRSFQKREARSSNTQGSRKS